MTDITNNLIALPRTAVALGFFDGLHKGHAEVINEVLRHKQLSPAVFTFHSDSDLPKRENAENLLTNEMKQEKLAAAGIEYVFSPQFSLVKDMTAREFVRQVLYDIMNAALVVCGFDFKFGSDGRNAAALSGLCAEYGIEVKIIPPYCIDGVAVHSSAVKELLRRGEVAFANKLLGYPFTIRGEVIEGNRIGRTIDSPTINQLYPKNIVMVKWGVYKSLTEIGGKLLPSVTNVGMKPTVNYKSAPLAETHILNFDGNLYGEIIDVRLVDFIRSERKFSDINALKAQLSQDKKAAMNQ